MKKTSIGSIIIYLLLLLPALEGQEPRFNLYCFYTPLFQELYESYFLPSLKDDFELVVKKFDQECPSGLFKFPGWEKTMYRKLQMLREAVLDHWGGQVFFYTDIDIIFLKPILNAALDHLGNSDFVIQQAWPSQNICAGFIIMRGNEKTLHLIDMALDLMETDVCSNDQSALQLALKNIPKEELDWTLLPSLAFPNGKRVLKDYQIGSKQLYSMNSEINLDDSILLFHANCCIGLEEKIHFLTRVQQEHAKIKEAL